jgi:TRAP-type uncharacterized transport system substrate-binding protein
VGQGLAKLINEQPADGAPSRDPRLKAVAVVTTGSEENADLIEQGRALPGSSPPVKFRLGILSSLVPPLRKPEQKQKLRGIAVLWNEYLQLVVSPAIKNALKQRNGDYSMAGLKALSGTQRLRIYLGPALSNTRQVAKALLKDVGLTSYRDIPGSLDRHPTVVTFGDAVSALTAKDKRRQIDAAFFFTGLPNPGVESALSGGCQLVRTVDWKPKVQKRLSLRQHSASKEEQLQNALALLDQTQGVSYIPAQTYQGVTWDIPTLSCKALLVGSSDLKPDQVRGILSAIFDTRGGETGQEDLVKEHEAAEQIRLLTTLDELSKPLKKRPWMSLRFHPGARAFWEEEARKEVRIAAGPLEGTSFRLGLEIAAALENHDIHARVVNTADDKESLAHLKDARPAQRVDLALLHNDAAAVDYAEGRAPAVKSEGRFSLLLRQLLSRFCPAEAKSGIRLISFLYPEAVHILTVRLPPEHLSHCLIKKEPRDFKELLELLIKIKKKKSWHFALLDEAFRQALGDLPEDRDTQVLRHYARLLGEDGMILKDQESLPRLSIAEAQNRLLTGHIVGAMVTSGVPMEAVQHLLSGEESRFKRLATEGQWCPYCGKELSRSETLRVRVLPLRISSPSSVSAAAPAQSQPDVPDSIQGLVENYRWFEPFIIPPETYPTAQGAPANTVAVKVVLVCREDCPNVYGITSALVDDEVRLRSVVRGIDLHNPLLQDKSDLNKDDPSIPVHPDALKYYQDHNILQKLPPQSGLWWERLTAYAQPLAGGLLAGSLLPWLLKWMGRWRAKRKIRLELELRNAYFQDLRDARFLDGSNREAKLMKLHAIWGKVLDAYEGRSLDSESANALDKLAREYDDYLRKDLGDAPRTA